MTHIALGGRRPARQARWRRGNPHNDVYRDDAMGDVPNLNVDNVQFYSVKLLILIYIFYYKYDYLYIFTDDTNSGAPNAEEESTIERRKKEKRSTGC